MRITHQSNVWEMPDAAAELWTAEQAGTDATASAINGAVQVVIDRHATAISSAVAQREEAKHAKCHGEKKLNELEHAKRAAHSELYGSSLSARLGEIESEKARLLDEIADARLSAGQAVATLKKLRTVAYSEIVLAVRELKRSRRVEAVEDVRRAKGELWEGVEPLLGKLVRAEGALLELTHTKPELHAETALASSWPAVFGEGGIAPFPSKTEPKSDEEPELESMTWVRSV